MKSVLLFLCRLALNLGIYYLSRIDAITSMLLSQNKEKEKEKERIITFVHRDGINNLSLGAKPWTHQKKKKFIFHLDVKPTFKNIKKVENAHSIVAIEIKRVIKYKYNYSLNKLIDY